jgi:hypothetical protein
MIRQFPTVDVERDVVKGDVLMVREPTFLRVRQTRPGVPGCA